MKNRSNIVKRSDFIQGVTRTKVIETRLLTQDTVDRMIESRDIEEALKLLSETEYSNSFGGVERPEAYELVLSNELVRIYELMRDISADPVVVDLLALKYDYHNLKVLIKEKVANKDLDYLYIFASIVSPEELKAFYIDGDFSQIPGEFKAAIDEVEIDFRKTGDPQRIDLVLDKYYFEHFYKMASATKVELFINYVKDLIDFTNIGSLIRLKKQNKSKEFCEDVILENGNIKKDDIIAAFDDDIDGLIARFQKPEYTSGFQDLGKRDSFDDCRANESLIKGLETYKETNRLSSFERYKDDYLMDINQPSLHINIGPEPIFSYIVAKETEIKTLRIVMVGKMNNLSPDRIRERVRELYV